MTLKSKIFVDALIVLTVFFSVGCKPTEKGYRNAYELAQQRDRENLDSTTYELMTEEAKPPMHVFGNDSVRIKTEPLKVVYDASSPEIQDNKIIRRIVPYNVVVAKYQMQYNALRHCDRLHAEKFDSYVLMSNESYYYVSIGGFDSPQPAIELIKRYNKKYGNAFVGMSEAMIEMPVQSQLNRQ